MVIRIHDNLHGLYDNAYSDRFNKEFIVKPGINRYTIDLDSIQNSPQTRVMELQNIEEIIFFVVGPVKKSNIIYISKIHLK